MEIYIQITCSVYGSNIYSDSIQLQKSLSDGVDTCSMMRLYIIKIIACPNSQW